MIHRKFRQVIEIFALRVGQPLVQIKAFVFRPQDTLLKDLFFQILCLINMGLEPLEMRAFIELYKLVACRAIGILQTDCKSVRIIIRPCWVVLIPLLCDSLLDAFEMENVLAAKLDDSLFSEALDIADDAVGISVLTESICLIFGNTIFV